MALRSWFGIAILLAALTASAPAPAQNLPPTVAAVVDYQRILRDSRAAKSIREQIETRRKLYLDQLAKEEQRLADQDRELARQRGVLAADVFAQRRREFETKVVELQKLSQERRRQLDESSGAALNLVRQALVEVVGEVADARGFNLVVPTSGLLLFSPKLDVTDDVLSRLDKKLPSVKVPETVERSPTAN